ncbi:histidine phosphatase family protein [Acidiphilium sp.]|uniref:histidine phosphatase family protein n=1 Tax=Acidiphilium sp. TaxID=527 RepID=UPI003CFD473F
MILLRHGQSEFNLHFSATRRDPGIADPSLTPLGEAQAHAAAAALADVALRRLIVSPYTRALQTAAPILARRVAAGRALSVEIEPLIRERYAFSCDIGSPRETLAERFPDHDFAHLSDPWWPDGFEAEAEVIARAARFRADMAARPDWRETIVVSHWAFILALTGHSLMNGDHIVYDPNTPPPVDLRWQP